ncbi:MAG: TIGR03905 family TSCPD domain-containing protein [Oscillospiraceae bacterium]
MTGDLHCHSRASDGSMDVEDIVNFAKEKGLSYLAITDHDSFLGVDRASEAGKRVGLEIIMANEISCFDYERNRPVHILCYAPVLKKEINKICDETLKRRNESGLKMIELVKKYYPVSKEQINKYCSQSGIIYKQHIMNSILDMGYTSEMYGDISKELFNCKTGKCYVHIEYPDVEKVVKIIKNSGGVAVVAHPIEFNSFDIIERLAENKMIDGIEINHPSARGKDEEKAQLEQLAKKYNLILTGGTDFHGFYSSEPEPIGSYTTDENNLNKLLELIKTKNFAIKEKNHMQLNYTTIGTCSKEINIEIDENAVITKVHFLGGCQGNLLGISQLVVGMKAEDVIDKFKDVKCGSKATSCPDQLAIALKRMLDKR